MIRIIEKDLSYQITGLCFKAQKKLGRFCREKQYCDEFEELLKLETVPYEREYNIVQLNPESPEGNRVDFFIDSKILVDFKAKNYITKEDYYQMLRYLTAAKLELGMIVNFRDSHLKPKRVLNSVFYSGNSDVYSDHSGRMLGIDYGEKRIGLAISDESRMLARELTILSPTEFWRQILKIIKEHQITQIVVGWPLNMSGQETEKTKEVEGFRQKLLKKLSAKGARLPDGQGSAFGGKVESKTGLPVEIMDERLSSAMANNLLGGNKNIDSLAAQIILQNYLNRGPTRGSSTETADLHADQREDQRSRSA